jgi:protein TonB
VTAESRDGSIQVLPGYVVFAGALVFGLAAALAMAALMHFLVHTSEMRLAESQLNQLLDFVRVKRSETTERKDRKPERPQLNEIPDAPPTVDNASESSTALEVSFTSPGLDSSGLEIDGSGGIATGDGNYLPIVKVAPIYPRRAMERNITGSCLVRYTVTTAGTVRDVEVIEESCPEQIFRRPSIEAAKRFRYKPRVADGVLIEVRGVRNVFHFERETMPEAAEE